MCNPIRLSPNPDDLEGRLDALGRTLASSEPADPPTRLIIAVRARARRVLAIRATAAISVAALMALATLAYFATRPHRATSSQPNIVHNNLPSPAPAPASRSTSPTLATLRALNPDNNPETLRFPVSSSQPFPTPTPRASDLRSPAIAADLLR